MSSPVMFSVTFRSLSEKSIA